jgi:hypothetical protein
MSQDNLSDIEVYACTILGEAPPASLIGAYSVAWAMKNRMLADVSQDGKPDWWGEGIRGVCLAPWQFSCWNDNDPNRARILEARGNAKSEGFIRALGVAAAVHGYLIPDPTRGSTHYYNPRIVKQPSWAISFAFTGKIDAHLFYRAIRALVLGATGCMCEAGGAGGGRSLLLMGQRCSEHRATRVPWRKAGQPWGVVACEYPRPRRAPRARQLPALEHDPARRCRRSPSRRQQRPATCPHAGAYVHS